MGLFSERAKLFVATILLLLVNLPNGAVLADETGLISIHELQREGRYYCAVTHTHTGQGHAKATKKRAIRSAARAWSSFTAWEYGSDWGQWRFARSKTVNCKGKLRIVCTVVARPCKRLRGRKTYRKRSYRKRRQARRR